MQLLSQQGCRGPFSSYVIFSPSEQTQRFLGVRHIVVEKKILFEPNELSVITVNSRNNGHPWDRHFVRNSGVQRKCTKFWSRTAMQTRKYCCGNIVSC